MTSPALLLVSVLKSLVEVAGMFLLGQGLLYLLAGRSREQNFVYRLFKIVTRPVFQLARLLSPRFVLDRHLWIVTILLLAWLWLIITWLKIHIYLQQQQ